MDFSIEKKISNFVESQFPQFYQEEGSDFILFMKAYYEWMESEGQAINQARSLFDTRDIDNTIESFLEYFQRKYLYGIPFNTIINKRFLLKHILDVYRSKGTIQCYKLLFKLIYNQDIEVYIPGADILKLSDGTWVEPKYLEITSTELNVSEFIGKTIIGASSKTTAVVENFISEPINQNIVTTLFISNVLPKGGEFVPGEKIVPYTEFSNNVAVSLAPTNIGSLDYLQIINGGQGFNIGDIIKIVHRDPITSDVVSKGIDGKLKVKSVKRSFGSINFNVDNGGFGYIANANIFIYKSPYDTVGSGASFNLSPLSYNQSIQYNTDLIIDFANLTINSTAFNFTGNNSANLSSNLADAFSYRTDIFGTIPSLTKINTGTGYTSNLSIFVRSTQLSSLNLTGNVYYTNGYSLYSITASGGTGYSNSDVIIYRAPIANSDIKDNRTTSPGEFHSIISNTRIGIIANTTGYSNTTESIIITSANTKLSANDSVYYMVPKGNTAIGGLTANTYYFVNYTNSSAITLKTTVAGANVNITGNNTSPGETHYIYIGKKVTANTTGFSNTSDVVYIGNASSYYNVNDRIYYWVPIGNTALSGLTGNTYYYVNFVNSTSIALANGQTQTSNDVTVTMVTNTTGGSLALTITSIGNNIVNSTPAIIIANSSGGFSNGSGASFIPTFIGHVGGVSTTFDSVFSNGDVIYLKANSSQANTAEYQVIKQVVNSTSIFLYGPPNNNSTSSASHKAAPVTLPSNFALYDQIMYRSDSTINGQNELISSLTSTGSNTIGTTIAIDSGRGYLDGEIVYGYIYNGLTNISIVNGGTGYANLETLKIIGGDTTNPASGRVYTNTTGGITSAIFVNSGSNYKAVPRISVNTANGTGAILLTDIAEYNTTSRVTGKIVKNGLGRKPGYWTTTRGFLNSDKYIQDSYFYQDYSYQIKAALTLDKYKDILYNTFHSAGSELFGDYFLQINENTNSELIYDTNHVIYISYIPTADSVQINASDSLTTVDQIP